MDRKSLELMAHSGGKLAHLKGNEQQQAWARRVVKLWIPIEQSAVAYCRFYGFDKTIRVYKYGRRMAGNNWDGQPKHARHHSRTKQSRTGSVRTNTTSHSTVITRPLDSRMGSTRRNTTCSPKLLFKKLVYVKGHQDKHKAYNRLSLRAQLNVDADDLASKYQQELGRARPFALMTPRTGGFLI